MQQEYYSLPLALDRLMRPKDDENDFGREHPRCSLEQSIDQHLHLLLTSAFGEFPADEEFGCAIWDNDFDNTTGAPKIKEAMRLSIQQSIAKYEKRLSKIRAELIIQQEELSTDKGRIAKRSIEITITGIRNLTNDKHVYKDSFFMGPLSY